MTNKKIIIINGASINDEKMLFTFAPDDPIKGIVSSYVCYGKGQRLSDGTFMFTPTKRKRSRSVLLEKLTHGRLSYTADNALQLTVKVFTDKDKSPLLTILSEVTNAIHSLLKKTENDRV